MKKHLQFGPFIKCKVFSNIVYWNEALKYYYMCHWCDGNYINNSGVREENGSKNLMQGEDGDKVNHSRELTVKQKEEGDVNDGKD
jgi:hypothetical protein